MEIAILTEGQYLAPDSTDWYIDQVLLEDRLVKQAFERNNYTCEKVDWSDKSIDWSKYKAVLFRSVWDYFHRFDEFCAFLNRAKGQTLFINSIEQIEWNMDKHYLNDLMRKGIPTVESIFIEKGTQASLKKLHANLGLTKTVIKPCVSGGGRHTYLLTEDNYDEHESIFREVISNESMILQPYQELITTKGEVSHIVIGGKHTHSILKKAKAGDYRVQDDFGGTVHEYVPSSEEISFAEMVAKTCEPLPAYARIDVIWDNQNEMVISEVELIEPELWFRNFEPAAEALAKHVIEML